MKSKKSLFISLILVVAVVVVWLVIDSRREEETACPVDAMLCPNGSSVGRTGPNCSFAPCLTLNEPSSIEVGDDGWTTYTNSRLGFSIQYPSEWFYGEGDNEILFTPLAPEDPRRGSSVGLASSLVVKKISTEQVSVIERAATTVEEVEINGFQGTLFLTPNAYAGGFNRSYVFLLSNQTYIQAYFYDGEMDTEKYPFEDMVETLLIQ